MSATSIEIDTKRIVSPTLANQSDANLQEINTTISYYDLLATSEIVTLSSNIASTGSSPLGLLYVPTLDSSSPCVNASAPYVPDNVTRLNDLYTAYSYIAIAPWLTAECVQEYLAAGRSDLVKTFLFFLPDQGNAAPPASGNASWNLGDDDAWKSDNAYPVYAISSDTGAALLAESVLYSGNSSTVPNAAKITAQYGSNDQIRLYATINVAASAGLPSLWIFLVVILAILLFFVCMTSLVMRLLQRHRRMQLRQRIANGEVDLEMLGFKKLLVPQAILDEMPCYAYDGGPDIGPDAAASSSADDKTKSGAPNQPMHQPTCAICIEDFVAKESQVRQLPCGHIFHPDCIDTFLMQISSLCPLCKKSSLPKGYCPEEITHLMVRRERMQRIARQRAQAIGLDPNDAIRQRANLTLAILQARRDAAANVEAERRRSQARPAAQSSPRPAVQPMAPPEVPQEIDQPEQQGQQPETSRPPPRSQPRARRQWAARRAEAMLGPQATDGPEDNTHVNVPRWKLALRRLFPTHG